MEITIKGRHWKPSATFREYAVEHIEKLTRFNPRLIRAQLTITREGYRHDAELLLHGNELDLLVKAEATDPRAALDMVLGKQERALLRRKGRMKDRKKHAPTIRLQPPAEATRPLPTTTTPEINVVRLRPERPVLSVDEAARTLISSKKLVLVFEEQGGEGLRVAYRLGNGQVGLLELTCALGATVRSTSSRRALSLEPSPRTGIASRSR
jgi:ribosomal subunit interface protein